MHKLRGESATCRCQNHHAPGKAHAMGSCGTAVTILLTGLLSHGLATHNERDTVLLGTLDALLWNHISEACKRNHPVSCQDYTYILEIRFHSTSIYSILHSTLPLLQVYIDELRCKSATRRWQKYHSPGKAHAMGSCGTADGAILLKELLGQGLATGTEGDSAVLCTPGTSLGDSSPSFATEITLCPAKLSCSNDACILEIQFHSASTHSILRPNSLGLPLLQMHIDELRGESLGLGSPNFGPKAKNRRLFLLAPVCVCQAMTMQGATASRLSALMFAHLCSCSHKHRWNTVRWQQSSLIATHGARTAADATRRANHMPWALVAQLTVRFSWRSCLVRA